MGRKLLDEQELALCRYLDRLDQMGIAAQRSMLTNCACHDNQPESRGFHEVLADYRDSANTLLQQSHNNSTTSPPAVGHNWTKRFLTRHPKYAI